MMLPMNEIQMSMKNPVALLCFTGLAWFGRWSRSLSIEIVHHLLLLFSLSLRCGVWFEFGSPTKMEQIS
jgi:hypothetical protein